MSVARRVFLGRSAAFGLGFAGLGVLNARAGRVERLASLPTEFVEPGYGPLLTDPAGLCDLPAGFRYSIISRAGDEMADGLLVPGKPDGMAAFPGPGGRTLIVCNHEVQHRDTKKSPFGEKDERVGRVPAGKIFDRGLRGRLPACGGTTTLVYDTASQRLERQFLSLAGTVYNCAGGPTPWGSWISCEESVVGVADQCAQEHGWAFEVPATAEPALADPVPIRGMGRFVHEALAIDPKTGIVYLTEDDGQGLLYRFLPADPRRFLAGGRLQALMVRGSPGMDTSNGEGAPNIEPGSALRCAWIDLEEIESPKGDLRFRGRSAGAARFSRGEGAWWGGDSLYFCCTDGGPKKKGQVWRYTPSEGEGRGGDGDGGTLTLFIEPNDASVIDNPDNITVSPWGDLIVCEDGPGENGVLGITPGGRVYPLARCRLDSHEWAGACFSPDGSTLFMNLQGKGLTLAVTGPWTPAGAGA
ncbi:MAG: DUF839 domain-containing protein [Phycisphaeraceae bacterium]|nr:MAG: DUF839 domain-containing protein [Phycisphaeraceae bacterium]